MINENFKTNYDLAGAVVRAGRWFRSAPTGRESVEDSMGFEPVPAEMGARVLARRSDGHALEVVPNPDDALDGHYNKWAFVEAPEPFRFEYQQPIVVSVYATSHGGGGPEEGGWSWDRHDLVAVFEIPSGPSWEKCHDDAEDAANDWIVEFEGVDAIGDNLYTNTERLVGFDQTVGGQHYA